MQVAPEVVLKDGSSSGSGRYVVIVIDNDAPYIALPVLSPILHWIAVGGTSDDQRVLQGFEATTDWVVPAPPPFAQPHRYQVLVYRQPQVFDLLDFKAHYPQNVTLLRRTRWDVQGFVAKYGLGEKLAETAFKCG